MIQSQRNPIQALLLRSYCTFTVDKPLRSLSTLTKLQSDAANPIPTNFSGDCDRVRSGKEEDHKNMRYTANIQEGYIIEDYSTTEEGAATSTNRTNQMEQSENVFMH